MRRSTQAVASTCLTGFMRGATRSREPIRGSRSSGTASTATIPVCCSATSCGVTTSERDTGPVNPLRILAAIYAVLFAIVTSLNYIPGLADAQGRTFGLDVSVEHRGSVIRAMENTGATVEHAYEYCSPLNGTSNPKVAGSIPARRTSRLHARRHAGLG